MGNKRNKIKKIISPSPAPPPVPEPAVDDDQLMDDLFAQLDSKNETVQKESANVITDMNVKQVADGVDQQPQQQPAGKDSKSRHKARQARKAAALAEKYAPDDADADARLQKEADDEEKSIKHTCDELGVEIVEITPDGHCLFSAVADQLLLLGILPPGTATYAATRAAAADYMLSHPDDFLPFLPSSSSSEAMMTRSEFEAYCETMRSTGAWGGEPEILALSRAYAVPVHVVQGGKPSVVVHEPVGAEKGKAGKGHREKVARISYHRRMYGLGEHYNSLRPKSGLANGLKAIFSSSNP